MRRSWMVPVVAAFAFLALGSDGVLAGGADLVWPADPVTLTSTDAGFIASIAVSNPSPTDAVVVAGENACSVTVKGGAVTIPARRSSSVTLEVAPRAPDCGDPADGSEVIVLNAEDVAVTLPIRRIAKAAEDPKPTGLEWPDDAVFLDRTNGGLKGEFTVFNPTGAPITVTPPVFEGCDQVAEPESPSTTVVMAHSAAEVSVMGPASCPSLDTRDLIATATAAAADGEKFDAHDLTLRAEVDWGNFKSVLRNAFFGFLVGASITALVVWLIFMGKKEVGPFAPLLTSNSSPSGWLSGIGTLGTVVPTLLATTGLAKGLTGVDETPQTTLVLAASAVAVALVAIAGVVTSIPAGVRQVQGSPQSVPFQVQFVVGAGLSAAAAALQLWAVRTAVERLGLISANDARGVMYAGLLAIATYVVLNIWHYIDRYAPQTGVAKEAEPSQELVGAIAGALVVPYGQAAGIPTGDREEWKKIAAEAVEDGVAAATKAVNKEGSQASQVLGAGHEAQVIAVGPRPRLFRNLI